MGAECGAGGAFLAAFHRVHLCRLAGFRGIEDLPEGWLWSSGRVFPYFCPLFRSVVVALLVNMALFRVLRAFLARFGVVVWVCVGLVLFVACGTFVCVSG